MRAIYAFFIVLAVSIWTSSAYKYNCTTNTYTDPVTHVTTTNQTCTDSCADGILNGDETKIDCGGSCSDCTDPCGLSTLSVSVREGDTLSYPICLIFANGAYRMHFYPVVDQFSLLDFTNSFTNGQFGFNTSTVNGAVLDEANGFSNTSWIQVQIGKALSPKMPYRYMRKNLDNVLTQYVVPYFTVVISLTNGVPQRIWFDEGCFVCDSDECNYNVCGAQMVKKCDTFGAGGSFNCDLKVYVAWDGTDRDQRYMTSSGAVLSQFASYSISSAASSLAKTSGETFPQFTTPIDPGGGTQTGGAG
jgi:hypothetical protein